MKGRLTSTITAKLFYLIVSLVLTVVVGITIQSSSKFKKNLTQNIQDGSISQAERAGDEISAQLQAITSKISVVLPKVNTSSDGKSNANQELGVLLRNDPEILTTSVFFAAGAKSAVRQILALQSPYPQKDTTDNRYEGKTPNEIKIAAQRAAKKHIEGLTSSNNTPSVIVRSIAAETGLPIMLVTVRFDFQGKSNQKLYVVLSMWQTRLLVTLPRARSVNSVVIDEKGEIFASSDVNEMIRRVKMKSSPLAKAALSRLAPSGFQDVFRDEKGVERLGAYAQINGHPNLFVLVQKNAADSFQVITRSYYSAILWAILFTLIAVMASYLGAGTATRSIRDLLNVTREIATGNFSARVQLKSTDEIAELGHSVNHMAGKITELLSTQVEKARFEKELETAKMVQSTFFPKQDVIEGPLSVTGFYQPATECGGDLWGHYKVSATKQIVFIADAMGHGAPAALVTAIGYATCQAVATILQDEPTLNSSPGKLLERLNKIIYDAVEGKISMTFFVALLDFAEGNIVFANAGHNFPVILTNNANDSRLSKQSKGKSASTHSISLQQQGTPLGVERNVAFKEKTIDIHPGDRIFFFTDGLIENHFAEKSPMGRKTLLELLSKSGEASCFDVKNNILGSAVELFGTSNLADDVTIVVAEIDKRWVKGILGAPLPMTPVFGLASEVSDVRQTAPSFQIELPATPRSSDEGSLQEEAHKRFKIKLPGAV